MEFLQKKSLIIGGTILISIVCFFLLHKSGALENAGMAAIILNWFPFIIGLFTIALYLLTGLFIKKNAWVVALLGNLFNLLIVIKAFFE